MLLTDVLDVVVNVAHVTIHPKLNMHHLRLILDIDRLALVYQLNARVTRCCNHA